MSLFRLFRSSPHRKLIRERDALLRRARELQRNGDVKGCAVVTAQAEQLAAEIERLEAAGD